MRCALELQTFNSLLIWITLQLITNFDGLLDILHSSGFLSFIECLNYK